jgi:type III secretory pathway component EscT
MIQDIFSWLLATFVIGPVQAEFATRMQAAQAPAAIVQQVQGCLVSATPILINRATSDMVWGITTTISVAAGLTDAKTVLAGTSPECAAAVSAVRPFLNSPRV